MPRVETWHMGISEAGDSDPAMQREMKHLWEAKQKWKAFAEAE
jgi:hypothetical protein